MVILEIAQIVGIGLVATILIIVVKNQRPEMAVQLSIVTGIVIFMMVIGKFSAILELLSDLSKKTNIDTIYITTLLKIIGIAYIAEFGAEICKDAGESSIASKIELAGKVMIMFLAVPIITSLLNLIVKLIN